MAVEKPDDNVEMKTVKKSEAQATANSFYSHSIGKTLDAFVTAEELSGPFTAAPHRYPSWLKLKRATAWINRFINNCQKQKEDRKSGELLIYEIKMAEDQLIKGLQHIYFKEEWSALS